MTDTSAPSCAISPIDPACTIDALIARQPGTIFVLNAFGIDTCCGGSDTIAEAAAYAHVDPALLLGALARNALEAQDP
jgi:iron-sulfur cluster repair protein YtfE (RIC family)